jgi:hypothetical protein
MHDAPAASAWVMVVDARRMSMITTAPPSKLEAGV